MRILAGRYKGRRLRMPAGIRPTQGKVRKALLDALGARVRGARCLDLFAGSGAVGLEMLSWGAAQVTVVERDPRCLRLIEQNVATIGAAAGDVRLIRGDALRVIPRLAATGRQFEVIFLDPPYSQGLVQSCLQILDEHVIVPLDFRLVAQAFWKEEFPNDFRHFQQEKVVRYGDTALAWYGPAVTAKSDPFDIRPMTFDREHPQMRVILFSQKSKVKGRRSQCEALKPSGT